MQIETVRCTQTAQYAGIVDYIATAKYVKAHEYVGIALRRDHQSR